MKSTLDLAHVKGTSAVALLKDGKLAGKIIANWSDNPAGSVCQATVWLWDRIEGDTPRRSHGTGRAGGFGYDKFSAAVYDALAEIWGEYPTGVSGGDGQTRMVFECMGYTYAEIL